MDDPLFSGYNFFLNDLFCHFVVFLSFSCLLSPRFSIYYQSAAHGRRNKPRFASPKRKITHGCNKYSDKHVVPRPGHDLLTSSSPPTHPAAAAAALTTAITFITQNSVQPHCSTFQRLTGHAALQHQPPHHYHNYRS